MPPLQKLCRGKEKDDPGSLFSFAQAPGSNGRDGHEEAPVKPPLMKRAPGRREDEQAPFHGCESRKNEGAGRRFPLEPLPDETKSRQDAGG